MTTSREIDLLKSLFETGVAAADPLNCVPPCLPAPPKGRTIVIGAGKAAASMAQAVERNWPQPVTGMVITRTGHSADLEHIALAEAGHPVPAGEGLVASRDMLALLDDLTPDDLVLFLASGGASSLFEVPASGLTLEDVQSVNRQLLACGAAIDEMNCLRKHLSAVKGGRLAARVAPARLVTIAISDVPGDDPSVIGSGPTVPDPTTRQQAMEIVARYAIDLPAAARDWLADPASETPKPGDPAFANAHLVIAARPADMLAAVAAKARASGLEVLALGADIEGEASHIGAAMAEFCLSLNTHRAQGDKPLLVLSGGETTVTVRNPDGRGGRNLAFLLSLGLTLNGTLGIHALAADTDGIDGSEDNAGAWLSPETLSQVQANGVDPAAGLANDRAYDVFETAGSLVFTGPTRTNVNDLRMVLLGSL